MGAIRPSNIRALPFGGTANTSTSYVGAASSPFLSGKTISVVAGMEAGKLVAMVGKVAALEVVVEIKAAPKPTADSKTQLARSLIRRAKPSDQPQRRQQPGARCLHQRAATGRGPRAPPSPVIPDLTLQQTRTRPSQEVLCSAAAAAAAAG